MRNLLFKLHLVVALVFGLFIVLLGVTGSIMAFEPEIDHIRHWSLAHVRPHGQPMSLAETADVVAKAYPDQKITLFMTPAASDLSYQVLLKNRTALYVDQYDHRVLGQWPDEVDFLGTIHQLHLRLAMLNKGRKFGEVVINASGVAALFLVITGAYLWWPTKRISIEGSASTRRFWFDLHNSFGILAFVFLLVLVVTGLIIGFEQQTTPLLYKLTGSQEIEQPRLQASPVPGAQPITPDQAIEIARNAVPGAAPFLINVPGGKQVYQVSLRYPEDRTPGGRTRVSIDPYTGKVLFALSSRTGPAGYRLVNLNRAIHTGDIFGLASKAVMSLASLIMALQLVSGVVMWLKRRAAEKRAERSVPTTAVTV